MRTGKRSQQRCLASSIRSYESDPISRLHRKGDIREKPPGTGVNSEVTDEEHGGKVETTWQLPASRSKL